MTERASEVVLLMSRMPAQPLLAMLEAEAVSVRVVESASGLSAVTHCLTADLVVLDARSHPQQSLLLCDHLRRREFSGHLLVLLPTRERALVKRFLDRGADDCLAAPFSPHDVLLRLDVLRHQHPQPPAHLRYANLEIALLERWVRIDHTTLHLTPLEFNLLAALGKRPGEAITREDLAALVWGEDGIGDCRVIDSHIYRLRKKLRAHGLTADPIHSMRGVGYVFRPHGSDG